MLLQNKLFYKRFIFNFIDLLRQNGHKPKKNICWSGLSMIRSSMTTIKLKIAGSIFLVVGGAFALEGENVYYV
jgi:hypothetical protein